MSSRRSVREAAAELPVLEWRPALVTQGSTNLIIPDRLPRGLS